QGSPSFYYDPAQKAARYNLEEIPAPSSQSPLPNATALAEIHPILDRYAEGLKMIFHGYYILDRNYNYSFHNALFLRSTPILPDFRAKGLEEIRKGRENALQADEELQRIRSTVASGPVAAFLDEIHHYVDYTLGRAQLLEEKTAEFQK